MQTYTLKIMELSIKSYILSWRENKEKCLQRYWKKKIYIQCLVLDNIVTQNMIIQIWIHTCINLYIIVL